MSQCLEMGFFDELETLGEPCTAAVIAKRCGYDPVVTERLLDTLASFQLVHKERNNKGMHDLMIAGFSLNSYELL